MTYAAFKCDLRKMQPPKWDAAFICCSVSAAPQGYVFYVYLRFDLNENSTSMWYGWHGHSVRSLRPADTPPKCRYGDASCWIKLLFLFSLCRKGVLVASLNSDLTTDGRGTILMMFFILFWALTVLFSWQSMGQSQASQFSSTIS